MKPANDAVFDPRAAENARLVAVRAGHWVGEKYAEGRVMKDIAADIRADIKAAVASGALPKGLVVGVRCSRATYTDALNITIKAVPSWLVIRSAGRARQDLVHAYENLLPFRADAASELIAKLEAVANAHNYDRSDIQSDYFSQRFFLHVGIDHDLEQADRERVEAEVRRLFA